MNVEKIIEDVYRITDFIDDKKFNELKNKINKLNFLEYKLEKWKYYNISEIEKKIDSFDVQVYYFDKILFKEYFYDIMNEFYILKWFAEKVYNDKLFLNNMWRIIKMQKWNTLWIHADDHSTIQWVIHLSDWEKEKELWWWLSVFSNNWEEHIIIPKKNSVIIFKWNLLHAVRTYKWEQIRYSIPFWFDNKEEIIKKRKDWIKCLKDLKICNDNTLWL